MLSEKTVNAARGKWRGILMQLGVPETALQDRHGPCPMCGGVDRFRFDNREGSGSYICGQCGAGTGLKLAMEFTGMGFADCAARIDGIVGNVKYRDPPAKPEMSDEDRKRLLRETVAGTKPISPGDLADRYLTSRHLGVGEYPKALRFAPSMRDGDGGVRPCMVALVGVHGEADERGRQRYCSLHRTFLRPDGLAKAEMASPRKLMPGSLPDGACVMLSDWPGHGAIGIAEGIETAMSASALFEMPVWAAINSAMLEKWSPPEGADEVVVFGDHDPKLGGHAAAYALAHRLLVKNIQTTVKIPDRVGDDWADELTKMQERKSACRSD